jgi:hypothetical protein
MAVPARGPFELFSVHWLMAAGFDQIAEVVNRDDGGWMHRWNHVRWNEEEIGRMPPHLQCQRA